MFTTSRQSDELFHRFAVQIQSFLCQTNNMQQSASTASSLPIFVSSLNCSSHFDNDNTFLTAITHFDQHTQLNYCYNKVKLPLTNWQQEWTGCEKNY